MNSYSKSKLMRLIQSLSFAADETVLYLDCHPTCRRALEYYSTVTAKLNEAMRIYQMKYGPIVLPDSDTGDTWRWIEGPWPWKYEANCEGEV